MRLEQSTQCQRQHGLAGHVDEPNLPGREIIGSRRSRTPAGGSSRARGILGCSDTLGRGSFPGPP
eukprot:2584992-Pyramimonas_sp.AAC.1